MQVPQFNLTIQYNQLKPEIDGAIQDVLDRSAFILGENVKKLEEEVAGYHRIKFGVGVGNGSDALFLALVACGVEQGDEVITTPFTFFATAGSIMRAGAVPVFVDIDPLTYNIDVERIEEKVSARTKAMIPVHLFGQSADIAKVLEIGQKNGLKVIEDAAQAMGAEKDGKKVASFGDAGCLSFFPTKNLGCFGDGGMVVTDDATVAERLRMLRVHGCRKKYHHEILGYNSRLDEIQAAVLRTKLPNFPGWLDSRNKLACNYSDLIKESGLSEIVKTPFTKAGNFHTYNQYTIRAPFRDDLQSFLKEGQIGTAVYYPAPLHTQPAFAQLGHREGDFPEAERACREVLSLPMFPELSSTQQEYVVDFIKKFYIEKGLL